MQKCGGKHPGIRNSVLKDHKLGLCLGILINKAASVAGGKLGGEQRGGRRGREKNGSRRRKSN